jgi:hypothetical protein
VSAADLGRYVRPHSRDKHKDGRDDRDDENDHDGR